MLVLFIGFCVVVGFTKLKKTAGGTAMVVKSLDERISHKPMVYLSPSAPRGPADQLKSPELVEAARPASSGAGRPLFRRSSPAASAARD